MESVRIRVKLLGALRGISGKDSVTVNFSEPVTVYALVQNLAARFGSQFKSILIDPELNDPRPTSLILVNDKEIRLLRGLQTKLNDYDTVTIIPVSHGG